MWLLRFTVFGFRAVSIVLPSYWIALATATHWPRVRLPRVTNIDKVFHFGAFAVLAFLIAWALPRITKPYWNLLIAITIAVGYGAIDELFQIPVGRTADYMDWLADSLGALFGATVFGCLRVAFIKLSAIRKTRRLKVNELRVEQSPST